MDYDYFDLVAKTKNWSEQAAAAGWISRAVAKDVAELDVRSPEALLGQSIGRPLIVAFMGGTGVGKSSLLNRLAGQEIARTGVERPTSKEVTLYHHRSVQLQQLPEQFPLEQIRIAYHDHAAKKDLIWIDMPDFDSTEQHNKEIVMAWLPYIDLLIYVVSPERYRDNKAWRLLLAEGNRHAWLFALNHWDRGDAVQFKDFKAQLSQAGFDDPMIFKTACTEHADDEFEDLQSTIEALANENTVRQLKIRGTRVRVEVLRQKLENCLEAVGGEFDCRDLSERWRGRWRQTSRTLLQGFEWPVKQLASYYVTHDKNPTDAEFSLWDDWAQGLFEDGLDDIVDRADTRHIPIAPLKQRLHAVRDKAEKIITDQTQLSVRQALANPGHAMHRFFIKLMFFCEIVLPLVAMGGVGYRALTSFYQSSLTHQDYLGVNFAIHSVLLIALSWLVPFFVQRKLKPSLEKSAVKGLKNGLITGMTRIETLVLETLAQFSQQRLAVLNEAKAILADCEQESRENGAVQAHAELERMLID